MKISFLLKQIAIYSVLAVSVAMAGPREDIDPAKLREMKGKILQSAKQIAAQYGNPAFSIIITSEDERSEQVKRRLAEMQKVDASEALLKDLESRAKSAQADTAAKESYLAALDMKVKGAQLELVETEKRSVEANARTQPQESAPQPTPPPQAPEKPKDSTSQTSDANASTNEVLKNLGLDQK